MSERDELSRSFEVHIERTTGYRFEVRFDKEHYAPIVIDEPSPLGEDSAPNAARYLAAAIGNCLSASLLFCATRHRVDVKRLRAEVTTDIARNESGRFRIGKVTVRIFPEVAAQAKGLDRCLEMFEDFCIVTQSVRNGIEVDVAVEPSG